MLISKVQLLSLNKTTYNTVNKFIEGGEERYISSFKAIEEAPENCNLLIHDVARPFIKEAIIEHQMTKQVITSSNLNGMNSHGDTVIPEKAAEANFDRHIHGLHPLSSKD